MAPHRIVLALLSTVLLRGFVAHAQLSPEVTSGITATVDRIVHETGVPSASVGIVVNGHVAYTRAFGLARLQPPVPATAAMAYPLGSISMQFTAVAVLLLQQEGKLSIDDPVGKYFPQLTEANVVTIRNLLTHTSGYRDYAPQDYTIPAWRVAKDPLKIVEEFATAPLDFQPGTEWQYSNTNFELAALIVQKVSGVPFPEFLRQRVLTPAGVKDVQDLSVDQSGLQVAGYMRNALAPLRPAVLEAPGWYFGDGDLVMPVASLLEWDSTFIHESLLTPESYRLLETPFSLKNGMTTDYGLGVFVRQLAGRRALEHSGEVGGFVAENIVFPDDGAAIAVLTNQEASGAASEIAGALLPLILKPSGSASLAETAADNFATPLRTIVAQLQQGKINRSLFTPDCNDYFSADVLADFRSSLAPLGAVTAVQRDSASQRGGMTFGSYTVTFAGGAKLRLTSYLEPDGKIEQLLVEGKV